MNFLGMFALVAIGVLGGWLLREWSYRNDRTGSFLEQERIGFNAAPTEEILAHQAADLRARRTPCVRCGGPLSHAPGIGDYCGSPTCDAGDDQQPVTRQ